MTVVGRGVRRRVLTNVGGVRRSVCALLLEVYGTKAAGGLLEGLRGKAGNGEGPVRRHWWWFVG